MATECINNLGVIIKLFDAYFNVHVFWETGRQNTQMSLFINLFTCLIINFSIQQITKLAVPNLYHKTILQSSENKSSCW